jgi:hypothetical protein
MPPPLEVLLFDLAIPLANNEDSINWHLVRERIGEKESTKIATSEPIQVDVD